MGSEEGMQHVTEFFEAAVKHFVSTFGDSVESFNPTLNNELEARFTQTFDCMRDFNPATLKKFAEWQQGRGFADTVAREDRNRDCLPHTDAESMRWWEFRNELLASTQSRFCRVVVEIGKRCQQTPPPRPSCWRYCVVSQRFRKSELSVGGGSRGVMCRFTQLRTK